MWLRSQRSVCTCTPLNLNSVTDPLSLAYTGPPGPVHRLPGAPPAQRLRVHRPREALHLSSRSSAERSPARRTRRSNSLPRRPLCLRSANNHERHGSGFFGMQHSRFLNSRLRHWLGRGYLVWPGDTVLPEKSKCTTSDLQRLRSSVSDGLLRCIFVALLDLMWLACCYQSPVACLNLVQVPRS